MPDAGSDPFGISCPSTHPLVSSLHGRTASVHLSLGSALQREDLASPKQGAGLKKGVWIAYPYKVLAIAEEEGAERASYALELLQSEGQLATPA